MTSMALKPSDSGSSSKLTIAISSKGPSPVGIGTNLVCLLCPFLFAFWHLAQPATYLAISSCYLSYMIFREISSWVRCLPQCPATSLSWCSLSTSNLCSSGTTYSLFFFSQLATSIASSSISSASPLFSASSSSRHSNCPLSTNLASIPDFSSPQCLDRPSALAIFDPGR